MSDFIYKGTIAVDFDAVISSYERPFKFDKLGKPNKEIVEVMQHYYKKGYYILIFTGRTYTPVMEKWLKKYKIPFMGFNVQPRNMNLASRFKPYYDCIIDDKAIAYHYSENKKTKEELIKEIEEVLRVGRIGKEE